MIDSSSKRYNANCENPAINVGASWAKEIEPYAFKKTYDKGEIIIAQGAPVDGLYILTQGRVKVYISDEEREMTLAILDPHNCIGEISVMDGEPRSASVEALEKSSLLKITPNNFKDFILKNPNHAYELIQILIQRQRDTMHDLQGLAFKNVYERVVSLISQNSEERLDGSRVLAIKLTHQQMADRVGASREMVSRILSELQKNGYITINRKVITLLDEIPEQRS